MALSREDLFAPFQDIVSASKSFADAGASLRQQAAQKSFTDQLPDLLASNDTGQIAQLALASGDPSIYRDLIQGQLKARTQTQSSEPLLTAEQIDALPVDQGIKSALKTSKSFDQQKLLQAAGLKEKTEQRLTFQNTEQRKNQVADDQRTERTKFTQSYDKEKQTLDEEQRFLNRAQDAFKLGTVPADAAVQNFIIRNLGGEKGPLSDNDRAAFIAKAFGNDVQKFQNFVAGGTLSTLTGAQRKALGDLLGNAKSNYDTYRAERLGTVLGNAADTYSMLNQNGKLDQSIASRAKREGFTVKQQDGVTQFVKGTGPKEVKVNPETKGVDLASLFKMADSIQNPAAKESLNRALSSYNGKVMSPETAKKFQDRIQALSGGQ